jgi:hypothetical protein
MKGCFDSIDGIKAEYLVWYEYFPDWSGWKHQKYLEQDRVWEGGFWWILKFQDRNSFFVSRREQWTARSVPTLLTYLYQKWNIIVVEMNQFVYCWKQRHELTRTIQAEGDKQMYGASWWLLTHCILPGRWFSVNYDAVVIVVSCFMIIA